MTPGQIILVEQTLATVDLDALAADFYRRAFTADPALAAMFTSDPLIQRTRFAAELAALLGAVRSLDTFCSTAKSLGARHRDYGVHAVHYRLLGDALLAAVGAAVGEGWTTEVEEAWTLAYNLTAETMMTGAMQAPPPS